MQIVPLRFCHISTKRGVLWPLKYAKIRFRSGYAPDLAGGVHDAPRDPLVRWRGDTPPHTLPHSALTYLRSSPCIHPRFPARSTPMIIGPCKPKAFWRNMFANARPVSRLTMPKSRPRVSGQRPRQGQRLWPYEPIIVINACSCLQHYSRVTWNGGMQAQR